MVVLENLTFIYSLLSTLSTLPQVSSDLRSRLIQALRVNPADFAAINHSAIGCT
ncbi:hypothetical protein [Kamptonema sp. UHCC 0994]|uniref:hypothetical protein n=1 Tax=Kamptonema sp. UHCC 0994 TaxID=3031329 RepID=UPI0023B8F0E0|nr:hypothetical protein [Kamptonema sp. UHCC 0994]MDF0552677.1 hypothetical protein [Kamptonema sp. UHCC 0994]